MYIDQSRILEATDGGLKIILSYYPQADKAVQNKRHKFKIRGDEKTASATLKKLTDGNWVVTDFGGDQVPRNGIMVCAHEEAITFVEACQNLANRFNIEPDKLNTEINKPEISSRDAAAEENDGEWYFEIKKKLSEFEVKTVLADKAIPHIPKSEPRAIDYKKIEKVFKTYHFHSLESYSIVKNRKVTIISATDKYPIFMWDEGTFKKIYQPLSPDKSRRFMYHGKRDKDFLHGLSQANQAFEKLNESEEKTDEEADEKSKKKKHSEVLYVSGGSDGLNLSMIGYLPVWPNSETAKLTVYQYKKLAKVAEKIVNLPDIDNTGLRAAHEIAMEHLELHTAYLPDDLALRYDRRGKPCKDIRDYLKYYNAYDFKQLLSTSLPYQFWSTQFEKARDDKWREKYQVLNTEMYHFLQKNGFARMDVRGKKIYVRQQGNVVSEVDASYIRDFINDFLKDRLVSPRLRDVFYNTTRLNDTSTANLPVMELEFNDHDSHTQYFFFENGVIKTTAKQSDLFKPGVIKRNTWETEVINHKIKLQEPQFKIFKTDDCEYDLEIINKNSIFLNYLINTSRIFWRKEYEDHLDGSSAEDRKEYLSKHKFDIAGPALAPEEVKEQKMHLINKIFTVGYLLHRYKDPSKPWAPFGTDHKISDDGESHGGSGKSFFYKSLRLMMNSVTIDGKKAKLNDDQFLWENVTPHTDYVLIDDLAQYINFESFFSIITGEMTVNVKNMNRYIIEEENSPKLALSSNFVPMQLHPSHRRRLIFNVFSDYYHEQYGDYRETRKLIDDFGKNLFKEDFTTDEWNDFYNFMIQCCQFYLSCSEKMNPPMDNVEKRNLISQMTGAFHEWADVFFSEDSGNRDAFVQKPAAFEDFKKSTASKWTMNKFSKALKAFAKYYGYELDPADMQNSQGRIIQNVEVPERLQKKSVEMIYMKTDFTQPIGLAPF